MTRVASLQRRLETRASPETRAWWTRYLRGEAVFRGVRTADIREELHGWYAAESVADEPPETRAELARALVREEATEDKLAGMLLFQEVLLPEGAPAWDALVPTFEPLFDEGHLADWNAVDWFCVRVLGPLVARDGEGCGRAVAGWRDADGLWRRRASAVAFVNLAAGEERFPGMRDEILASCAVLADDPARFSQTGAGWVLRELSVVEPDRVAAFVEARLDRLSREAVRSAVRKLPEGSRERILAAVS